ncbi:hypothetical protein A2U01_0067281, partial [Trifolium medium]|nr:hypothetical protein [Trifolium medium]
SKDNAEIITGQSSLSVPVATSNKVTPETVDESVKEKISTSVDAVQDVEASKDLSNPIDAAQDVEASKDLSNPIDAAQDVEASKELSTPTNAALTDSFGSSSESKTST